ncbi:MAG: hypothetical protein EOO99_09450 [Pedobacter sp.]|nr:MAG: hypothetical protein EOO99_09450 [Pedobacter sp.]
MRIKANEATHQRPEGDRLIDAPLVELNLPASILQIKNESTWHQSDRNSITLFKSSSMRIVLIGLRAQAEMKPHKANGQLSVQVIEGEIIFATDTQQVNLKVGQMISLHENIAHSVEAVEDSFILLTLAMPNH